MYISELSSPQLLVIYPGRFQPFHKGHHAVYEFLASKFGRNNVFIATSNKVDGDKSPFTFSEKAYFMQLAGVPADRIVQATNPYQIENILQTSNIQVNSANTVVIFAVSEKDMSENPRFKSWTKKDGSPAYFQPLQDIKNTKNMTEHGYILTVPTFDFNVLGQPMRSGTELRRMYIEADAKTRQAIIKDLFGKYTAEAEQIMTNKLAPAAPTSVQMTPHPTEPQAALGEHIVKHGSQYRLLSKHGNKNLGTFPTKAAAEKHEREVQYFKHAGESVEEGEDFSTGELDFRGDPVKITPIARKAIALLVKASLDDRMLANDIRDPRDWNDYMKDQARRGNLKSQGVTENTNGLDTSDAEMQRTVGFAKAHYPGAKTPSGAFHKFVQRSLAHAKEDDTEQNIALKKLAAEILAIKQQIASTKQLGQLAEAAMDTPQQKQVRAAITAGLQASASQVGHAENFIDMISRIDPDGTIVMVPAQSSGNIHVPDIRRLLAFGGMPGAKIVDYSSDQRADPQNPQHATWVKEKQAQGIAVAEDAGGVGVIASKKQANDPRYSTSLTKDVQPGQIAKNLKAFNLTKKG